MAEVEYAGVKVSGSKMLLILPLLGTLGGALWGGFEFYKDYMDMKEQIQSYVSPDLSGFQEQLSVQDEKLRSLSEISASHVEIIEVYGDKLDFMQNGIEANEAQNRDMKNNMRDDISRIENIVESVEDDIKAVEADVREMIDLAEQRAENKRDALQNDYDEARERLQTNVDRELKELEERLNKRLQRALDNPLAN